MGLRDVHGRLVGFAWWAGVAAGSLLPGRVGRAHHHVRVLPLAPLWHTPIIPPGVHLVVSSACLVIRPATSLIIIDLDCAGPSGLLLTLVLQAPVVISCLTGHPCKPLVRWLAVLAAASSPTPPVTLAALRLLALLLVLRLLPILVLLLLPICQRWVVLLRGGSCVSASGLPLPCLLLHLVACCVIGVVSHTWQSPCCLIRLGDHMAPDGHRQPVHELRPSH